jgi:hypothetical protein
MNTNNSNSQFTQSEQSVVGQQSVLQQQPQYTQPVNNAMYSQQQANQFEQLRGPNGELVLNPNEPGIKIEERIQRQKLFYEAKLAEKEQEKENALEQRLEADAEKIRLQDRNKALEQKNRIIENQYTASFRRGVNAEVQNVSTPEGKVRETFVGYISGLADFARKVAPMRHTYLLV